MVIVVCLLSLLSSSFICYLFTWYCHYRYHYLLYLFEALRLREGELLHGAPGRAGRAARWRAGGRPQLPPELGHRGLLLLVVVVLLLLLLLMIIVINYDYYY